MMKSIKTNQVNMKLYKVLDSFIILFMMICLLGCKESSNSLSKSNEITIEKNINHTEKQNCLLTVESLKNYEAKLKILYKDAPNLLNKELVRGAKKFSAEIESIFSSVYESEFNISIDYEFDSNNCSAKIHYLTSDTIEIDGETYSIESSVILILSVFNSEIKITSILIAG